MTLLGACRLWDKFEKKTTRKFTQKELRLWDILVFISRFALLAIPFQLIIWTNFDAYRLQVIVAEAVSRLLHASGINVIQADNFIYIRAPALWTIEIIKDCVGWKSFLALSGLMFAVRGATMKSRISGMILGAPVIFAGNIFRIYTSLYASTIFGLDKFSAIHDFLWQIGMMALILGAWFAWMRIFSVGNPR